MCIKAYKQTRHLQSFDAHLKVSGIAQTLRHIQQPCYRKGKKKEKRPNQKIEAAIAAIPTFP